MMKPIASLLLAAVVAMCGCSSLKTHVGYDSKADFASLKSFNWIPYPAEKKADVRLNYDFLDQTIRASVNAGLQKKGLKLMPDGQPDFRVRWYVALNENASDTQVSAFHGFVGPAGWGYGSDNQWVYSTPLTSSYQMTYMTGAMVVDFVDAKTDKLIWRGAGQAVVNKGASQEQRRQNIDKAIQKILLEFPPVVKK